MIRPFLGQDYLSLKSDLLSQGRLFEDEAFPASNKSVYRDNDFVGKKIEWKRPIEFTSKPKMFSAKVQPENLDKGFVKNCELIDALPVLLINEKNFNNIIDDKQDFFGSNYSGIFHFRFWLNGEWTDVVIDDRLPVDENNQLLFCKNTVDKDEMFGPLLEKAFAKFKVCYEFLNGLTVPDIMLDLTGAVVEKYDLTRCLPTQEYDRYLGPKNLWEILFKYSSLNSLFTCSVGLKPNQRIDQLLSIGIHAQKVYTVKKIYEILKLEEKFSAFRDTKAGMPDYQIARIKLLLIQNPLGKTEQFKEKWDESSIEWNEMEPEICEILKKDKLMSPNQFFVDFDKFYATFSTMHIYHQEIKGSGFEFCQIHNEWQTGKNSGGCGYYPGVFWTNPQHEFDIPKSVKHSMGLISVIQKDDPESRLSQSEECFKSLEEIGFHVYAIKPNAEKNPMGNYEKPSMKRVATIKKFKKQRQVSKRVLLPPSKYVIMPCTYDKDKDVKYLLRYYFDTIDKSDVIEAKKVNDDRDAYDKWYYEDMNEKDIENLIKKADNASSAACSLM